MAFVPAYAELRTFAVERIRRAALQEQTFEPVTELETEPFKHSLGAYRGTTCRVQLQFHPRIATYIKERSWHASQRLKDRADGSVVMAMDVCDDYALRSWILSWGRSVRVLIPEGLVEWITEELAQAERQYAMDSLAPALDEDTQPGLPFLFDRVARA